MITRRAARLTAALEVAVKEEHVIDEKEVVLKEKTKPGSSKSAKTPKSAKAPKVPKLSRAPKSSKAPTSPTPPKAPEIPDVEPITKRQSPRGEEIPIEKRTKKQYDNKLPVKKKLKRISIDFESSETDPIINHLKEYFKTIDHEVGIDTEILDQIALEGLSGITLARLFRILDAIYPNLNCIKDENCQNYVWAVLVNKYLNYPPGYGVQAFYSDPKNLQNQDDNPPPTKGIIIDKQIRLPSQTIKRIAKVDSLLYPVQDGSIMGSCANYLTRSDITQDLIEESGKGGTLNSMYSAHSQYGLGNISFVASQTVRSKAILPSWADPNIDIKLREYCALELIGKSRTLGTVFPNDKTLGRYRIMLMAKGLITQFQQTNSSPIEHHLRRFAYFRISPSQTEIFSKSQTSYDDIEDDKEQSLSRLCCNPSKLKVGRSTFSMVYDVIAQSGGLTQLDIRKKLNLPKFHVRNHLKNLLTIKMIYSPVLKDSDSFRIYRTAHKSMKRRRKRRKDEFAKPTGIMAKWDDADLRAKRIIGHKRSSFSQAEDSLLILCRITSILIDPEIRLSWCVHKRLVRDLLHRELVESHDKTSDACLRRIKYLKRLPNNIMSINELTAELRDDPDIMRLIPHSKPIENEDKLNKIFVQVLRTVRAKIPDLLGITMSNSICGTELGGKVPIGADEQIDTKEKVIEIKSHQELKEKFELVDCQSVAAIMRAPTYEQAKNVVDIKFNNACLVTMAFTISSSLDPEESVDGNNKLSNQWLLDKFYSGYHDKLISSMLSKLNKRSLLTRKCPPDQASLYKPRTKMPLKLNQSVLFLLNRYQSSSLMQLAHPISQLYKIDLRESNKMASIALLTSLCSSSLFTLDLKLKIPTNVVGIDQGNENFKSLCEKANDSTKEILARFMSRCGGSLDVRSAPDLTTSAAFTSTSAPAATTFTASTPGLAKDSNGNDGDDEDQDRNSDKDIKEDGNYLHQDGNNRQETVGMVRDCADTAMTTTTTTNANNKMDDSRRALFLLRHELKTQALDKCGSLSDCLIVQPCNVIFYSEKQLVPNVEPLGSFLDQAKPIDLIDEEQPPPPQQQQANWLVKSFRFPKDSDRDDITERDFEADKIKLEFYARLWKRLDGSAHMPTLFKLIESLLSWIIVFPGVERDLLQREFGHLMPEEHLLELLTLMESLELVTSQRLKLWCEKPRLFGYKKLASGVAYSSSNCTTTTYEPSANAYVQYCQLLSYCK